MKDTLYRIIALSLILTGIGYAEQVISEEVQASLDEDQEFVHYFFTDEKPHYIPVTPFQEEIRSSYAELPLEIGVEVYFIAPLPKTLAESPDRDLEIYNILNKISSLEGIQYYSASRKRMRTFFKQAYVIDSLNDPQRKEDLSFSSIPTSNSVLFFQEDLTFGKNNSQALYSYDDGVFTMKIVNKTSMKYLIPIIPEEGFVMTLQVIPREDHILFYGACGVDMLSLFGVERSKKDSFYNRLKAMYNWFFRELINTYPD